MSSRAARKRNFEHLALDNELHASQGLTTPLAQQPARTEPAPGSWDKLAALSAQVMRLAAGVAAAPAKSVAWMERVFCSEEMLEETVGVDGPSVPGAWVSCPATCLFEPPSPQVSYTIPGTYRLTYDDGMSDLEDDVGTDSDVPMPTPPNPHCIRFSVTGIPCYWRAYDHASSSEMDPRNHASFAMLCESLPRRSSSPTPSLSPSPTPSPELEREPQLEFEDDLELQKHLGELAQEAERVIREKGRRDRALEDGEAPRKRSGAAFTRAPEDIVIEDLKGLALNDSEYRTLVRYEQETRKQTARERVLVEKRATEKRRADEAARQKAEEEERARRAAQKLVQEVTPEIKQKIKALMDARDMEKWADNVGRLNRGDMGTLLPQAGVDRNIGWLNDAVINEYLATIVAVQLEEQGYEKKKGKVPRVHAFQSAFFKTWSAKGYDGIKRWVERAEISGNKLLKVDMMLIPICNGNHWTLLAISGTGKTIQYFNSMSGFGSGDEYVAKAKEFLAKQLGTSFVEDEWTVLSSNESNQQINGSDCGVFTSLNGHALLMRKTPREVFETKDKMEIAAARNYMAAVLLGQHI